MQGKPVLVIFGGPNGSGKSSAQELDARNSHVRFDERDVKTEPWFG